MSATNLPTVKISIDANQMSTNKSYKSDTKKKIIAATCALLNSDGGEVECSSSISPIIRQLEQAMNEICGSTVVTNNLDFQSDQEFKIIKVDKADTLITTNYNIFLPSHSQIVQLSPKEPIRNINKLLSRKFVELPVECGSHCREFFKDNKCNLHEEKTREFKQLKSGITKEGKKGKTLADRMTGDANRFSDYVSGFANHRGGHVYYGIHDDGVVEGQSISNEKEQVEIENKVEAAIKKLLWPEQTVTRGEHWETFFEPVMDNAHKPIPLTYVIVVYIGPCMGAVFVKKPECYEIVNGTVSPMSFSTWKKRISSDETIPNQVNSITTWHSPTREKHCVDAFCTLTHNLSNGDWKAFQKNSIQIQQKYPKSVEIKLVILFQKILAHSQKQEFNIAAELLKDYEELVPKSSEKDVFEVLRFYARAAHNCEGSNHETKQHIRDAFLMAVAKLEQLRPGLVSALVNLFAGTVTDCLTNMAVVSLDKLSCDALQHLRKDPEMSRHPDYRAVLERKGYLNRAALHLGCSFSGNLIAERVDDSYLEQANSDIKNVEVSIKNNPYVTKSCEIQLDLVNSMFYFRQSQNRPRERKDLIQKALEFSQKAESDAEKCKFHETVLRIKYLQLLYMQANK